MGKKPEAVEGRLALLEETATVSALDVVTGRVRISTHVETIDEVVHAALERDDVEVVRVPIDRPVIGPPPQMRTDGDLIVIPVLEEVLVVETRLMLKEELHVRKRTLTENVEVPVKLRRQHAEIDRSSPPTK